MNRLDARTPLVPAVGGVTLARFVEAMGGRGGALAVARWASDDGEYRWCAAVGKRLVFAEPGDGEARDLFADAFEQLGYRPRTGPGANAYLAGARGASQRELRHLGSCGYR